MSQDAQTTIVKKALEQAGWRTLPDVPASKVLMKFDTADVQMTIWSDAQEKVPRRFCWRFCTNEEIKDIFVDYGDQLEKLVSIVVEYAPEVTTANYRGVVAAIVRIFPAVYTRGFPDGEELVQLRLED